MSVERGVHQSAVLCPFTWDESCSGDSSCRPGTSLLNRGNAYFLFPPKRPKELSAPERDSEAALMLRGARSGPGWKGDKRRASLMDELHLSPRDRK